MTTWQNKRVKSFFNHLPHVMYETKVLQVRTCSFLTAPSCGGDQSWSPHRRTQTEILFPAESCNFSLVFSGRESFPVRADAVRRECFFFHCVMRAPDAAVAADVVGGAW